MAGETRQAKAPLLFTVLAAYLIFKGFWNVFVPGGSWPLPPWPLVSMATNLVLVAVLVAFWTQMPERTEDSPATIRHAAPLFWCAFAAGIVNFLIRFTSEQAWWTGHLTSGI